jgi:PadR family transcriptional regulator AphA
MQEAQLTTTSFVVLGLVGQLQSATPYDLKRAAAESVTNFWSLPHSQLYSECARLAEAGYLAERREETGRRRRTFSLTSKGADALERWRDEPAEEFYELRDAGLLKLYFGAEAEPLADRQLVAHRRKLAVYEAQLAECGEHGAPSAVRLAVEAGIGHEREYIRYWSEVAKESAPQGAE